MQTVGGSVTNRASCFAMVVATEQEEAFAVVNLAREFRPEMAVDRRAIRSMDQDRYRFLKLQSLDSLLPSPNWLTFQWLWDFGDAQSSLIEPLGGAASFQRRKTSLRDTPHLVTL